MAVTADLKATRTRTACLGCGKRIRMWTSRPWTVCRDCQRPERRAETARAVERYLRAAS